jgi:O-antigen ligase
VIDTRFRPTGLRLASYVWGFQILVLLAQVTELGPVAGQVIDFLVSFVFFGYLYSLYAVRNSDAWEARSAPIRNHFGAATTLCVLLFVWSGLSFLWTPTPVSDAPFYLKLLVQAVTSYMLCKLYPIRDVLRSVCIGTVYGSVAIIPMAVYFTGYSGGRLGEVSAAVNLAGQIAVALCWGVFSVVYLVGDRAMSKRSATLFGLCQVVGLFLCFAKTELIALALVGVVYVVLAPGAWGRRLTRMAGAALIITIVVAASSSKISKYANSRSAQAETLSGRLVTWAQTYEQISSGPYIRGFGIMAFRELGPQPYAIDSHAALPTADNEFVTLWFNLGLVGVVLVFGSYFALGFKSIFAMRRRSTLIPVIVLCTVIFHLATGFTQANAVLCAYPVQWLVLIDCLASSYALGKAKSVAPQKLRMME